MKSSKRHVTDGMERPNQDKIRTLGEKETYKYLGILEADNIKKLEMKEKISRNPVKGIDTWAVPVVKYFGQFLKWTREQEWTNEQEK